MRRIQRQRAKGWRMPPNTVYVGRPSRWGNPYRVGETYMWLKGLGWPIPTYREPGEYGSTMRVERCLDAQTATDWYAIWIRQPGVAMPPVNDPASLRGKNLACWCPLDAPCHADVLLELAS